MLTADRLLGALVLVKALDVLDRGAQDLPTAAWGLLLALWGAAGLALVVRPRRLAWAAVAVAGAGLAYDFPTDLRRQHLVLMIGTAVAAAVATSERERLLLWRVQLTVLYGIACLAKLNESFLTGNVVAQSLVDGPVGRTTTSLHLLVLLSALLVVLELALAVLLHVRPRAGLVLACLLHGGVLVLVTPSAEVFLRLLFFGGTAVVVYAACARALAVDAPGATSAPASVRP